MLVKFEDEGERTASNLKMMIARWQSQVLLFFADSSRISKALLRAIEKLEAPDTSAHQLESIMCYIYIAL
jgi:hypothetical protein